MKEALTHILDQSVCLTRRQMKDYLSGTMPGEEQHAAEVHLASCPLCSMAMEGFETHSDEALAAIASLNSGFLKEHYDAVTPQIHLNSVAPAMAAPRQKKAAAIPLWKTAAMAAGIVLAIGAFWYFNDRKSDHTSTAVLADNKAISERSTPISDATPSLLPEARDAGVLKTAPTTSAAPSLPVAQKEAAQPIALAARKLSARDGEEMAGTVTRVEKSSSSPSAFGNAKPGAAAEVSTGGGHASGTAIVIDKVDNKSDAASERDAAYPASISRTKTAAPKPDIKKEAFKDNRSAEERADELFDKGKYQAAAVEYKKVQQDEEGSRRQRSRAGIQAARAYAAAGQKGKAISVLNAIIAEGGPQRRAAKRLLRELQGQ